MPFHCVLSTIAYHQVARRWCHLGCLLQRRRDGCREQELDCVRGGRGGQGGHLKHERWSFLVDEWGEGASYKIHRSHYYHNSYTSTLMKLSYMSIHVHFLLGIGQRYGISKRAEETHRPTGYNSIPCDIFFFLQKEMCGLLDQIQVFLS